MRCIHRIDREIGAGEEFNFKNLGAIWLRWPFQMAISLVPYQGLAKKLEELEGVLKEGKEERAMRIAEMKIRKGENIVKYEDEIMAWPKRTWFTTKKGKAIAKGSRSHKCSPVPINDIGVCAAATLSN
jgi:hypothetical protein